MNLPILLGYAAPYRASLALASVLMLLETAAALAVPWLGGKFAGAILVQGQPAVNLFLSALLALFAFQAALKFANSYILGRSAERILADLRIRIYDHLQALPLDFYHQRRQGDILALITYEVAQLSGFITGTLLSVIPLLLTLVGSVIWMLRIDARLTGLIVVLVPLFYLLLKVVGRRLRPLARQQQQAQAAAIAIAEENLGMLPVIKTFTREALESQRHSKQIRYVMRLNTTQQKIDAALQPAVQFIAGAGVIALLWLAGDRVNSGTMTPAELVTLMLYAGLLTRPVSALAGLYGQVQATRGTLERLQDVLTEKPEPILAAGQALARTRGEIEFRNVSFAYPGRPFALRDINLRIRGGEAIGLIGENGAGKSTLVHLLMRLHEPDSGQILIDGTDIANVTLHSLRNTIGIVPQHVLLLNGSVHDNIAYGKLDATQAEIEHAAQRAQAHGFITRLPQGYDTLIGDQGVRLSGGQRQRVSLARALLKDPLILVLDEATAMFDPEGERSFVEDFRETFARRTVILITHRPTSLALADRTIKLDQGKIVTAQISEILLS